MNTLPSQFELRQLFKYDESTGVFTYIKNVGRKIVAGSVAGSLHSGYIRIAINGKGYRAHRLAWIYFYGNEPVNWIDHVNGQRHDNRITNLREATVGENNQNRVLAKNNASGYPGVSWDASSNKWRARIGLNGKQRLVGLFDSKEDAALAYRSEKKRVHPFQTQVK